MTALGKKPESILSMHVSSLVQKKIWTGQYIDLAYLLETQLVPDDEKAYEFSCSNNNTNKLSLTTAKPKAKVDSYTSWNKAFWVLTEIVTLRWLDQCLPMVQYAAELCNNIGKFPFQVSYNVKFRLKKQSHPYLPWNEIDNRLWTKCFTGVKESNPSSAFPPPREGCLLEQIHEPVLASIHSGATDPSANFHKSTANVFISVTPNLNAGEEHQIPTDQQQALSPQLIAHLLKPVTPINPSRLDQLLQGHPNRALVQEVVTGFQKGFSLKYNSLRENCHPHNLPTAFSYPEKLWDNVMKEIKLERMLGPFLVQPFNPLICSPVGMVEKKNSTDMHRITHLSYPRGTSINSFIDLEDCKTNYQTLDMALKLVAENGQ